MKWRLRLKKSFIALCIESEMALDFESYHKKCLVDKSKSRSIAYVAPSKSLKSLNSLNSLKSLTSPHRSCHKTINESALPFLFLKKKKRCYC